MQRGFFSRLLNLPRVTWTYLRGGSLFVDARVNPWDSSAVTLRGNGSWVESVRFQGDRTGGALALGGPLRHTICASSFRDFDTGITIGRAALAARRMRS